MVDAWPGWLPPAICSWSWSGMLWRPWHP